MDRTEEVKTQAEVEVELLLKNEEISKEPVSLKQQFKDYIKLFLNPGYHLKKIVEDIKAAKDALAKRNLDELLTDRVALAHAFRGRLFATFILSGVFGMLGPLLGTATQYSTGNPYGGLITGVLIANIFGTTGYQIIWSFAHRKLYKRCSRSWIGRFVALQRDLIKMQLVGFVQTLAMIGVVLVLMLGVIWLIEKLSKQASMIIPFAVIGPMVEMVVVQSMVVRAVGDLFERHSWVLADTHGVFDRGEIEPATVEQGV